MESLAGLATVIALSAPLCSMVDEAVALFRARVRAPKALAKVKAKQRRRGVFDAEIRVQPNFAHVHKVIREGRVLKLIGEHSHTVELTEDDMETLSETGMISVLTSRSTGDWRHPAHSHNLVVTL